MHILLPVSGISLNTHIVCGICEVRYQLVKNTYYISINLQMQKDIVNRIVVKKLNVLSILLNSED